MIYLDHAATSFPKAPGVGDAMKKYIDCVGVNINRGVYSSAQEAEGVALSLRQKLCALFSFDDPSHVVLTPGNTWGLNQILQGYLNPGDHCIVSSLEHNSVMRPLQQLQKAGISFDRVPCNAFGVIRPEDVEALIRPNTRLVLIAHASNVCGTLQDAKAIGEVCLAHHIPFCLDAAQSAGHVPIDFGSLHLSALSVPGHKGLLGPQGIGALLLKPDFAKALRPLFSGGTGSVSDSEEIPPYMPDRFEPGTPNLPGIYGLDAALSYLLTITVEAVAERDQRLCRRFLEGLAFIPDAVLVGPLTAKNRVGVFSLDFPGRDNAEVSMFLAENYGIMTRCGLHCAPAAHRALGTFPQGTVRFSFGHSTTEREIDLALEAIRSITSK